MGYVTYDGFFFWIERIFLMPKGMLEELKRDNGWSRWGDRLWQINIRWVMSQTIGSM